ncbi:MAG: sulfotransferase domain-containing protein [bacterium]
MRVFKYFNDYISIKKDDIFLVSYPKSGNTRFRLAIAKYIELKGEIPNNEFNYEFVNNSMPELGKGNINSARKILKNNSRLAQFPLFIKSHLPFSSLKYFHNKNRNILIERLAPETMMSYYDYAKARGFINQLNFSDFLRNKKMGIKAHVKFINSWLPKTHVSIDYEELIHNDEDVILNALEKLNVKFDKGVMSEAIVQTRREKATKFENKKDNLNYNFAAKKKRELDDYFSKEDILYYNKQIKNTPLIPISL